VSPAHGGLRQLALRQIVLLLNVLTQLGDAAVGASARYLPVMMLTATASTIAL
jgi:hypothetical protein